MNLECPSCSKIFKRNSGLVTHMKTCVQQNNKCIYCEKTFVNVQAHYETKCSGYICYIENKLKEKELEINKIITNYEIKLNTSIEMYETKLKEEEQEYLQMDKKHLETIEQLRNELKQKDNDIKNLKQSFELELEKKELILEKNHSEEKFNLLKELGIKTNQTNNNNINSHNIINHNYHLMPPLTPEIGENIIKNILDKQITHKTTINDIAKWITEQLQYFVYIQNINKEVLVFRNEENKFERDQNGYLINQMLFSNPNGKELINKLYQLSKNEFFSNLDSLGNTEIVRRYEKDATKKEKLKQDTMKLQKAINKLLPVSQASVKFRFEKFLNQIKEYIQLRPDLLLFTPLEQFVNLLNQHWNEKNNPISTICNIQSIDIIYIIKFLFQEIYPDLKPIDEKYKKIMIECAKNSLQKTNTLNYMPQLIEQINKNIIWFASQIENNDEIIQSIVNKLVEQ